jgi:NAD+ synthase
VTTIDSRVFELDGEAEADRIAGSLRRALRDLSRRGLVVATSGGIDSSVCAALAVRAVGPQQVFCVLLPERDGSSETLARARQLVRHLGVRYEEQDISATLEAIGCYARRDAAVRAVFPDYASDWKFKIAIRGGLDGRYNTFHLIVAPAGTSGDGVQSRPLAADQLFEIVGATNYKQRIRKTIEYCHADRLNYAVVGTPNRLEYDQGFFVKNGDGAADVKPIAHLYKTQVYALARALALPAAICAAEPTTDTYSLAQGQDEFYFGLPVLQMDYAVWARNHDVPADTLAAFLDVTPAQAERIYHDIDVKRRTTRYLHRPPILAGAITEAHR